jgi:2Fe-2S ferredoxin
VGERGEMENSMLEFSDDLKPNSRLACQIQISEELEGLTVDLPEAQY